MNIKHIDISKIIPNGYNANEMPERQFKALVHKIKTKGYSQPIEVRPLTNDTYEIVDGYHRYLACKEVGLGEIECVVSEMDERSARIESIAKNKIRGLADPTKLALIIAELSKTMKAGELVLETGLDSIEISDALELMELSKKSLDDLKERVSAFEADKMLLLDFAVTTEQRDVVERAVKHAMGTNKTNKRGEALAFICAQFMA